MMSFQAFQFDRRIDFQGVELLKPPMALYAFPPSLLIHYGQGFYHLCVGRSTTGPTIAISQLQLQQIFPNQKGWMEFYEFRLTACSLPVIIHMPISQEAFGKLTRDMAQGTLFPTKSKVKYISGEFKLVRA
jgi:hypothetical protein